MLFLHSKDSYNFHISSWFEPILYINFYIISGEQVGSEVLEKQSGNRNNHETTESLLDNNNIASVNFKVKQCAGNIILSI